ncbi:hypothetical protein Aph01nite_49130 [Acrocarpospora phusangensis]|uniref:Uncharacterized protein n=1 Tax=Acrocarpospora phusangensis TaxID=1070424 RepID=A0A919QDA1_9ACTN|nr:hypothetical protein Aph01nite_49130 [Acrocarpospora phusangensis]
MRENSAASLPADCLSRARDVFENGDLSNLTCYAQSSWEFALSWSADDESADRLELFQPSTWVPFLFDRMDHELAELGQGGLQGMILAAGDAALICVSVTGRLLVTGLSSSDRLRLASARSALQELAAHIRSSLRLPEHPHPVHSREAAECPSDGSFGHASADRRDVALVSYLKRAVSTTGLHYVAFLWGPDLVLAVDLFDDLPEFFVRGSRNSLRHSYESVGVKLHRQAGVPTGGKSSWPADLGPALDQVTLSLEQGTISYVRVRDDQFIVGATVGQGDGNRVADRIAALADELKDRFRDD